MATPQPSLLEDERLPLILGFQRIAETRARDTCFMDRGRGIYLYDTDGREYIEATSSFYVAALGYQHAELIDAISAQYRELPFYVSAMKRTTKPALDLAEKLVALLPVPNAHVLFASSGSEAIDFLVKMIRFQAVASGRPHRQIIIGRHGSYHGGTLASASLTGGHHAEFSLPLPGFLHVSQPDYHGAREPGETPAAFSARLARELDDLIAGQARGSVAAFFAEPVSFSAGFKVPPAEYHAAIARVLRAHEVDLVADEVVTGFGRTGQMWGTQTFAMEPAHVTIAKAVTGGYFPLSAVAIGNDLYQALERGSERFGTLAHASTYAAHPVGAAAALKVLEIIKRDGLIAHAAAMGERLRAGLARFREHPWVGDVRGLGLAASIDFLCRDGDDRPVNQDADERAAAVCGRLLDEGVIARPAGRNVIFAPPLIIQADEVDEVVRRVGRALEAALNKDRG